MAQKVQTKISEVSNETLDTANNITAQQFIFQSIETKLKNFRTQNLIDQLVVKNDYEIFGIIAYLHGLDFTSQRIIGEINPEILNNIKTRLTSKYFFTEKQLHEFYSWIKKISFDELEKISEDFAVNNNNNINSLITNFVKFDNNLSTIYKLIQTILESLIIKLPLAEDFNILYNKIVSNPTEITFHDLLKVNMFINRDSELLGNSIPDIIMLQTNQLYGKLLHNGADRFDFQKFNVIYFDLISTLKEYFIESPERFNWLTVINDFNNNKINIDLLNSTLGVVNTNTTDKVNNTEDSKTKIREIIAERKVSSEQTDLFLKSLIEDQFGELIETEQQFMDMLNVLISSNEYEDLLQHIYSYIAINREKNREIFEDIYQGLKYDKFISLLTDKLNELKIQAKELNEAFMQDLSSEEIEYIKPLILKLIKSDKFKIDNSDIRAYLIQQVSVNQIKTFKQLYQTIDLIEQCSGDFKTIKAYMKLYEYLNNDKFKTLFESADLLEPTNRELQFFNNFKRFFQVN